MADLEVVRSEEEVNELVGKLIAQQEKGYSKFQGMRYEEGVRAAIDWLVGDTDEDPMAD